MFFLKILKELIKGFKFSIVFPKILNAFTTADPLAVETRWEKGRNVPSDLGQISAVPLPKEVNLGEGPPQTPSLLAVSLRSVNILRWIHSPPPTLHTPPGHPCSFGCQGSLPCCVPTASDHLHNCNSSAFCQSWFLKTTHLASRGSEMQITPLPKAK